MDMDDGSSQSPVQSRCLRYLGQHVYTVTARWARMPRLGREGFNGPSLFGGMSKRKPAPSVPMLAGVGGKVVNTGGGNTHDRQCM